MVNNVELLSYNFGSGQQYLHRQETIDTTVPFQHEQRQLSTANEK